MATESGAENAKKPNVAIRIGRWFKAAALELKKTTWPKPNEVLRKLGIVLVVVALFFLVLMAMDQLLSFLYGLLVGKGYDWGLTDPPPAATEALTFTRSFFKSLGL